MIPGFKTRLGEELRLYLKQSGASTDSDSSFDEEGNAVDKKEEVVAYEEQNEKSEYSELGVLRQRM